MIIRILLVSQWFRFENFPWPCSCQRTDSLFAADTRGHEVEVDLHAAEGHTPAPAQGHEAGSETALTPATVAAPGTGPGPDPGLEIAAAAVPETGPGLDPGEETMIRNAHVHQRTEGEQCGGTGIDVAI